jgi:hypothetical protein
MMTCPTPGRRAEVSGRAIGAQALRESDVFRRVDLILPGGIDDDGDSYPPSKEGLMAAVTGEVLDAWIDDLAGPSRSSLPSNCRFYFTEKGWREVGRKVVAAAQRTGQEYRVVAIKETDAQVVWRDRVRGYEVAVQPPSKRRSTRTRPARPSDAGQ